MISFRGKLVTDERTDGRTNGSKSIGPTSQGSVGPIKGFKRLNTSPWLKKILKFIDLKRTEIKGFKRLNTSPWLKKILKFVDLKRTEMKGFKRLKTSTWSKKILKFIDLKRTEIKVLNK